MTVITLHSPRHRLTLDQRRQLSQTLTDAVLEVEIGQVIPAARAGFQVWFRNYEPDELAIGGALLSEQPQPADLMLIEIDVMAGHWPASDRRKVIENTYRALGAAVGVDAVPPGWWVVFRSIDEGSWGSRGEVLSILALLDSGVFTADRAALIRQTQGVGEAPGVTLSDGR